MTDRPPAMPGDEPAQPLLRHCPMEAGGLVGAEECLRCPHRPRAPLTVCSVSRGSPRPRARGFWDSQPG